MKDEELTTEYMVSKLMRDLSPFGFSYFKTYIIIVCIAVVLCFSFGKTHLGFLPFSKGMNAHGEIKLFNDIVGFYTIFSVIFSGTKCVFRLYPPQLMYIFRKYTKNCYEELDLFKNHSSSKIKRELTINSLLIWFTCFGLIFFFMFQNGEVQTRFSNIFSSGYILPMIYMIFMYFILYYVFVTGVLFWEQRNYVLQ